MERLIRELERRKEILVGKIWLAERNAAKFPKGRLRCSKSGKQRRFYHVIDDYKGGGEYITSKDEALKRSLAQKDYNAKFLQLAKAEIEEIERFKGLLDKTNADMAYRCLPEYRRELVRPYLIPDNIYVEQWLAQPFKTTEYKKEGAVVYETKRKEKVRSKSELMIANMLYDLGIPCKYEKELRLRDGSVKYPDFTLLNVKERCEIYWEHAGLLESEGYRRAFFKKVSDYSRNGIHVGANLIVTIETEECPLDTSAIREMLQMVFR